MPKNDIKRMTLDYVAVSNELTKRAFDQLEVHEQSQAKAASVSGDVLNSLIESGCVSESQKQAAESMLGSHAETLGLLKSAAQKIAAYRKQVSKQASDLGQAVEDNSQKQAANYDSLTSPFVGAKTGAGVKKASDEAILKVLGPPS